MNVLVVTVELATAGGVCHGSISSITQNITNLGHAGCSMPLSDFFALHQQCVYKYETMSPL